MNKMTRYTRWFILLIAVGFGLIAYTLSQHQAEAGVSSPPINIIAQQGDDGEDEPPLPSNDYCMLCHADEGLTWTLPNGETLPLTVDPTILQASVHGADQLGDEALACADCHGNYRFPHPVQNIDTAREFTLIRYASCRNCHEEQYLHQQDSVHGEALREGELEVAVCIDCHGAHDIHKPDEPRERISLTCGQCHGAIFEEYTDSVHGAALFEESNQDVPTCIDCHGVHNIDNPQTAAFRVRSPDLCAECHGDEDLMAKYDVSTNVLDSYLTDFHGTTVSFFHDENPEAETNKAVCFDCHGVHNIQEPDEEHIRENLLTTCRQCHPDATANFPSAWVGHYEPTLESNPLLVVAQSVYGVAIPLVGGLLVLLILTDIFRRLRRQETR